MIKSRGNTAIDAALKGLQGTILIPEEGGWIHFQKGPKKLGLDIDYVKCNDAKIDLNDLKDKLNKKKYAALLYQNPGGYFAQQPMEEIYELCKDKCKVIIDVTGAIGTKLCDANYADVLVGSFSKLTGQKGGFMSKECPPVYTDRINFLLDKRAKVIKDLGDYDVIHPTDLGFVVVVKYQDEETKNSIIKYCTDNNLPYTECPRYIRLNHKAISIEIKQLQKEL
jgi:hypothetical protein